MNIDEIANELVAGCRENRTLDNLNRLYALNAISVEAKDALNLGTHCYGVAEIAEKQKTFAAAFDVTSNEIDGPLMHGEDRFALIFRVKGRDRSNGVDFEMREIGIYHIAEGRIVREEFYY